MKASTSNATAFRAAGSVAFALALSGPLVDPVYAQSSTVPQPGSPRVSEFKRDKDRIESVLSAARKRSDYGRLLMEDGFSIAKVNEDQADYVEYEVVKGDRTYEIRLSFDDAGAQAKKINVTRNTWTARETRELLNEARSDGAEASTNRSGVRREGANR